MTETVRALWYTAREAAEIRAASLPPAGPDMLDIEVEHSLLSRGTERLVWQGGVPASEHARMRAPMQEGEFPFPVKYGYAAAGRVVAGPSEMCGRRVFALAPHQTRLRLRAQQVVPIPDALPTARAVLAANMETALNAVWDAMPPPGARVLVVGLGLVGCLIMAALARRRDLAITVSDISQDRAAIARHFDMRFTHPEKLGPDYDIAFHTSASPNGLAAALGALAFEGVCIELSWYGDATVPVPLGAAFHSQRLTLRSSQVGHIAPSRRARTSHRDRLAAALSLLDDPRLDRVVTDTVAFDDLPDALPRLLAAGAPGIAARIDYAKG